MDRAEALNELTDRIIAAAFDVHTELGPGHLEGVYQDALAIEFRLRRIPFVEWPPTPLRYKGHRLRRRCFPDFIVDDQVVVELKVVDRVHDVHMGQVLGYLNATGLSLGLLLNFNVHRMRWGVRRVVAEEGLFDASVRSVGSVPSVVSTGPVAEDPR